MDKVNFIHTEVGKDIIISLSFDEDTEFGIDGFTIIRTPKFEFALMPYERGACLNWDEETKTPWLSYEQSGAIKQIYYENEQSLSEKITYVNNNNLNGIAIWALGYEGNNSQLWSVINNL